MNARTLAPLFAIALAASLNIAPSQAANLTITDTCGRTVGGSASSASPDPVVVNGSGDIQVTGYSSTAYAAGIGQCAPVPADGKPICTVSVSSGRVAKNTPVTLSAVCTAETNEYIWLGTPQPAIAPNPSTASSISLSFDKAGAYTYTVTGKRNGVSGVVSAPVTILVGDATDTPTCSFTLSPPRIAVGASATAQVVCQPQQDSLEWDPKEANAADVPPDALEDLAFPNAGTFTYKVMGRNAVGGGPKASATVTVAAAGGPLTLRAAVSQTTSGTFNFPPGTQPGDWLVLYVLSGTTDYTVSGWSSSPINVPQSGAGRRTHVFVRQAGSTETSVTVSPPVLYGMILAAYSGATGFAQSVSAAVAPGTACTASLTRSSAGGLVVSGLGRNSSGTMTPPTSFTTQASSTTLMSLADRAYGSIGTTSATWNLASTYAVCWFLELIP